MCYCCMNVLSWNVRGLYSTNKKTVVRNYVNQYEVDVVCLKDTMLCQLSSHCLSSIGGTKLRHWESLDASSSYWRHFVKVE